MSAIRHHRAASEHVEQALLLQWAHFAQCTSPELAWLYAIPNGGDRHPAVAAKLKAEGVKSGVPDLCLPVARGGYHALYVEMKAAKGRVSDAQSKWHDALRAQGNAVRVCFGWLAAKDAIEAYLAGGAL